MNLSYGPPGQKGIQFLMAVGADELPPSQLETATSRVALAGAALAILGLITGSRAARDIGAGAGAAAGALFLVGRRTRRVIAA